MGDLHPQVVHFANALLVVGVLLRAASLLGRPAFASPAATTLLGLGTLAAIGAALTGSAAYEPVEAMPGLSALVQSHATWGEGARNLFFIVVIIEVVALSLRSPDKTRIALITSAVLGALGLIVLYLAASRGGEIVYAHGGGVGIRSGKIEDVGNLLLAGIYQQALLDRQAGRAGDAAALIELATQRFPTDPEVQILKAESLLLDRQDAGSALTVLRAIPLPDDRTIRLRHGLLTADALVAAGQRDGAIATLQQLQSTVDSPLIQDKIDQIRAQ